MKSKITIVLLFLSVLFISCDAPVQESETTQNAVASEEQNVSEQPAVNEVPQEGEVVEQKIFENLPAVVLRDDARVWLNEEGVLSSNSIDTLDMGSELIWLGVDEELKSGSNSYLYSKVRLNDGREGWISTVRLVKNARAAVVVEPSRLYSKPSVTTPLEQIVPAAQIVAVSLDKGNDRGFAEITFSWYDNDRISSPVSRYIEYDNLSSAPRDIDVARLVLKAFRNSDMSHDFFNLAFSLDSTFNNRVTPKSGTRAFAEWDESSDSIMLGEQEIDVLAVNPHTEGLYDPWYIVKMDTGELRWIQRGSAIFRPVLSERIDIRPELQDFSGRTGKGVPSVNFYQGLAFRKLVQDKDGNDILVPDSSLEIYEVVYSTGNERVFDDITYLQIEKNNGETGWASKAYIAELARPAVILSSSGIPVFREPKLTALENFKLDLFQVLAAYEEQEDGFMKISYISVEDGSVKRDMYIQSSVADFSYDKNCIDAAVLFDRMNKAETPESQYLYIRTAVLLDIPFEMSETLYNYYYDRKEALDKLRQSEDAVGSVDAVDAEVSGEV